MRRRLDAELVRRRLADSRELAQQAIADGRVRVRGAVADKASRQVDDADPVVIVGPGPRFVSRGGEKLDAALDRFGIEVRDRTALDAGASTGGFTDCLLQRGAGAVVCVDVGHGQLHERMRNHPQVENHERMNVRTLRPADLGGRRFTLVVGDLSFISLRAVAPALVAMAAPGADLVLLVKPQFEATRAEVGKGRGVIRDHGVWARALDGVSLAFERAGAAMMGAMASPITGTDGNVEFLVHLVVDHLVVDHLVVDRAAITDDADHTGVTPADVRDRLLREALAEAGVPASGDPSGDPSGVPADDPVGDPLDGSPSHASVDSVMAPRP